MTGEGESLPDALAGHYTVAGHPASHLGLGTPGPVPYRVRVTVRDCCEARGLSVYQVAMSGLAQGTVDRGAVYRLARGEGVRLDFPTLEAVAGIIAALSGQPVGLGELLTFDEAGPQVRAWGLADLAAWKGKD